MLYELTVTLRPSCYKYKAKEQARLVRRILEENVFKGFKVSAVFELTQEDNIHIHALIDLLSHKDRAKLLNRFRPYHALFGRKTCTQLVHYPEYVSYLSKDFPRTRDLDVDPIIKDDYEILGDIKHITTYLTPST